MGGAVKAWSGQVCRVPGCEFELLLYTVGSPTRTFPLCPFCYNNPREDWLDEGALNVEDIDIGVTEDEAQPEPEQNAAPGGNGTKSTRYVLECPLPDAHPCITDLAVAEDEESGGVFILDPGSCGKNWSCVSTRAATTIKLPPSVLKAITLCVAAA